MDQRERMLAGLPYKAWMDGLAEERLKARKLVQEFNMSEPEDFAKRTELIGRILGKVGKNAYIEPPFRCDYGSNIEIGDDFYANYNCI
ncbi:MAG: sugar O-acetyltransferase, partial [Synergistales bacterium]|nr:sugar O-acetyltransferase [Synergistales bacterium]